MKLCIAEKPSVAKEIADVLGAKTRKDGFYEGNGYWVSWTFGHFCTLKEPHDYYSHWKEWRLEELPIIPSTFGIKLIENGGVKKQYRILEKLIHDCEQVINCGDAGQEGELIQRWVLLKAKNTKPVKRLWISSLTTNAIKEGFNQLKDAQLYNNLYAAGSARAIGDWLLGINATRLFTKKFAPPKMVLSIGRVQTPTLAMIVQRQKEIDAFVSETYWELKTIYKKVEFIATIDRLKNIEKANSGLAYLEKFPFEITDIEVKENKEGNPKLFDLTGLQVEANKKYGYTAEDTLKYVQSLYEKKLVTYPRVDTTYLSDDLYPKVAPTLRNLTPYANLMQPLLDKPIPKSKNVFDNTKVTDHHAIIPTGEVPSSNLSIEEKRIYDRIARRFIAVFYPECKVSNTTVLGKVGEVGFKATGKQILEPGWRIIYASDKNDEKEDGEQEEKVMPSFTKGESGPHKPFIHQGKTTPPKAYTEATLLRAMETAGKQVDDEEMRELMKDNGIGRPSTRANIIETLFKRNYIARKKKNIIATPTGMELIDCITIDLLKSPELTGVWERKLRLIEKGEYELEQFKNELFVMVKQVTSEVKSHSNRTISTSSVAKSYSTDKPKKTVTKKAPAKSTFQIEKYACPKCKQSSLIKGNTAYGCKHFSSCGFKIPFTLYDKKLSDKNVVELIEKGMTSLLKGIKSPVTNELVNGKFILNDSYVIEFIVQ